MASLNSLFPFLGSSTDKLITNIAKYTTDKPYEYQVWVYSCVSMIANNLSSLGKYIYNKRTEERIDDHPVLDLFTRTNAETFGETFWESVVIHLMLEGQLFILPDDMQDLAAGQIPRELYLTKDKYMKAKSNQNNIIDVWKYTPGQKDIPYTTNQLIRVRLYNPYDKTKGMPPLLAAMPTIIQDANATSYTANFFKNNCQIGGVLSTGEKLTEEQAKFIASQFSDKYSGTEKVGKTPILHSGLTYQAISSTFKDMQIKFQQDFIKERILAAFKVPKSLVSDYSDVNYSNSITAKKTFWQESLLPIDRLVNEAFTYQWIVGLDKDWELRSDLSKVEALQDIQGDKVTAYTALMSTGMPKQEAARLLNIPVDWDYVEELEEADAAEEPAAPPASTEEPTDEEEDMEDQELDIRPYTKTLKSSLNRYFTKLRNKCLDKIDAGKEVDYTLEEEFDAMTEELKGAYLPLISNLISEIKDVSVDAADIVDFLNRRSSGYKELLSQILSKAYTTVDKRVIHEMFQDMYQLNKSIAEKELPLLISFIKVNGVKNDIIQQQNGE